MSRMIVRGVQNEAELTAAHRLVVRIQLFQEEKAWQWLETAGRAWPGFAFHRVRIVLLEGQLVGALRVIDVPLRIGQARLAAGGIGWVSTEVSARGRGVCSALMADTRDYMIREGFELSLLFGVPDLYQRFGFVSAIPERSVIINVEAVPKELTRRHRQRTFRPEDIPAMVSMHHAAEGEASCSIARHEEWVTAQGMSSEPKTPYWADWSNTMVLLDDRELFCGWLMPQRGEDEMHIKDLGTRDESACESLLNMATSLARQGGCSRLRFHVPPYHRFARYLTQFESIHETRYFRNREGMLSLLHLDRLLTAMIPEWESRWVSAGMGECVYRLHLRVEGEERVIIGENESIRVEQQNFEDGLEVSGPEGVLLLSGCSRPEDVLRNKWNDLSRDERRMVTILFPQREPFIWPIDHF